MSTTEKFDKNKYGYVFNIQHYSVHDGPGIRTIVFLKGCPLECQWCSNPESQKYQPELAYNHNKCIGIGECIKCLEVCVYGAIEKDDDNKIKINRNLCSSCFNCANACPAQAITVFGKLMSVNEVIDIVEKDSIFYGRSDGGMTLSGGEVLVQHEFALELLKEAKKRRINTAIETSGYGNWQDAEKLFEYVDYILYDIKCMHSEKHKKYTGVGNEKILENFKKLCLKFPKTPILVRTPIIPGFNDTEEDILEIINFIKGIPNVQYELLAYHRLGEPKYTYTGREYQMKGKDNIPKEKMNLLNNLVKKEFINN